MPGPNWLATWIKVNSKHVSYAEDAAVVAPPSNQKPVRKGDSSPASCSTAYSSNTTPSEPQQQPPPSVAAGSLRHKGRRRLQRVRSASDILREIAQTESSHSYKSRSPPPPPSLLDDPSSRSAPPDLTLTGKFLNETAFLQQYDQQQAAFGLAVPDKVKLPLDAEPKQQGALPFPSFFNNNKECANCQRLQDTIVSITDDLEYLRSCRLQHESSSSSASHPTSWSSSATTTTSTSRLDTTRHKKQIEQLMKERSRWQQDMHFKLHKFANLCKDLNEESALRDHEAMTLRKEWADTVVERDELAGRVAVLEAQAREYERKAQEHKILKQRVEEIERRGLHRAEDAIAARDAALADLATKLEQALKQLEIERNRNK